MILFRRFDKVLCRISRRCERLVVVGSGKEALILLGHKVKFPRRGSQRSKKKHNNRKVVLQRTVERTAFHRNNDDRVPPITADHPDANGDA